MTTKRKVAKTIWVARQTKTVGWYDEDEYIVFVQKAKPELEEDSDWAGVVSHYFPDGVTTLCAPQWHRATGIRLKRGEVVKIKVSVVK